MARILSSVSILLYFGGRKFFLYQGQSKGLEAVKLVILKIIDFACDFFCTNTIFAKSLSLERRVDQHCPFSPNLKISVYESDKFWQPSSSIS
jgi:hypothetical protein